MSHEQIQSIFETININKSTLSNIDNSSIPNKSEDEKFAKNSPRKKDLKPSYGRKGKAMTTGKSLTSYLDKRPSFKSFSKSKHLPSKETNKFSPRYTLSEVYTNGGKPFIIEDKVPEKLLWITNIHHNFNETATVKSVYPFYDYILINVQEAYLHPRKPRGPFNIK